MAYHRSGDMLHLFIPGIGKLCYKIMVLNSYMGIMGKNSFFLTDLMKTGDHQKIDEFLSMSRLGGERITSTGEYYTLHQFNLDKYDRLFAIVDHQIFHYTYWQNADYRQDIARRVRSLKEKGFKFIIAHPWESMENMKSHDQYRILLQGIDYHVWHGEKNWFWFLMHRLHKGKTYNIDHGSKSYDFIYLNRQSRPHRRRLFDQLLSEGVLDKSLYSFLDDPHRIKLPNNYELPWVGDGVFPRHGGEQEIYEPQYNDTTFNLVSETNDNDTDVFMTEKIWKPIIAEQIFVVHGNHQYLKSLRQLGFMTFDNVFDESYDDERDTGKRINKIVNLCKNLRQMDRQKIYQETKLIRKHNRENFFNKDVLTQSINNTVLDFFKFADRS